VVVYFVEQASQDFFGVQMEQHAILKMHSRIIDCLI
jgi:hypothetical protein